MVCEQPHLSTGVGNKRKLPTTVIPQQINWRVGAIDYARHQCLPSPIELVWSGQPLFHWSTTWCVMLIMTHVGIEKHARAAPPQLMCSSYSVLSGYPSTPQKKQKYYKVDIGQLFYFLFFFSRTKSVSTYFLILYNSRGCNIISNEYWWYWGIKKKRRLYTLKRYLSNWCNCTPVCPGEDYMPYY